MFFGQGLEKRRPLDSCSAKAWPPSKACVFFSREGLGEGLFFLFFFFFFVCEGVSEAGTAKSSVFAFSFFEGLGRPRFFFSVFFFSVRFFSVFWPLKCCTGQGLLATAWRTCLSACFLLFFNFCDFSVFFFFFWAFFFLCFFEGHGVFGEVPLKASCFLFFFPFFCVFFCFFFFLFYLFCFFFCGPFFSVSFFFCVFFFFCVCVFFLCVFFCSKACFFFLCFFFFFSVFFRFLFGLLFFSFSFSFSVGDKIFGWRVQKTLRRPLG